MKKALFIMIMSTILLLVVGYGLLKLMNAHSFQLLGELINKAGTEQKVVALTFDDGPTSNTDRILQVLQDAGVKATFFVTGASIEQFTRSSKNCGGRTRTGQSQLLPSADGL